MQKHITCTESSVHILENNLHSRKRRVVLLLVNFQSTFHCCLWAVIPNMLKVFFFFLVFSLCMPLHSEVSCSFAARDCQAGRLRKSLQNWQHGITQQEQLQLHSEWSGCACNMPVHKVLFKWQRKQITRKLHGFFFFYTPFGCNNFVSFNSTHSIFKYNCCICQFFCKPLLNVTQNNIGKLMNKLSRDNFNSANTLFWHMLPSFWVFMVNIFHLSSTITGSSS